MKKKIVSLTLAATMSLAVMAPFVAGCAGDSTDYEHTIVFYSSQGDTLQGITKRAIEKFEAKYPGWTVEHSPQGGYDDVKSKIMSDLEGEQQPDLAYCYPDHVAQYLTSELVLDMNKFINSTETVTGVDEMQFDLFFPLQKMKTELSSPLRLLRAAMCGLCLHVWK